MRIGSWSRPEKWGQTPFEIGAWPHLLVAVCLAGCATQHTRLPNASALPSSRPGAYYQDDGPGLDPPANLEQIPDATPRLEPLHRFANRPYSVLGRDYVPATELRPYRERGIASWYGRKYHAQRTSIGDVYDMYAMTAAHPTLPLPSYARVTNLANGRSVIVRVNDRGPFLHGRIIDLSYTAAARLGYVNEGSARVEVEAILAESMGIMASRAPAIPIATPTALTAMAPAAQSSRAPALPMRAEGNDVFVQLGAFSNLDNAENFLTVVEFQLSGASGTGSEIVQAPRIRARDNQFRVELGPFASRSEAQRAAAEFESRFGVVPATGQ